MAKIEAESREKEFEVWPENWATVEAFLLVSTQWRVVQQGGGMAPGHTYWIGLDYAGVAVGLSGHGIDATPEIWRGLRVMEAAARNTLNGAADD